MRPPPRLSSAAARAWQWAAAIAGVAVLTASIVAQQPPQPPTPQPPPGQEPPRFRSSVEVTSVDVSIVDDKGKPIAGLKPEDFTVRVDGAPRRVVSAEWVSLATDAAAPPPPAAPDGYSTNESSTGGPAIVVAV